MQNKVISKAFNLNSVLSFGIILFLLMSFSLNAQTSLVEGSIKDSNGVVVPFASLEFYSQGETQELIDGTMTEENGTFKIEEIPFGEYELVITAVGFSEFVQKVQINKSKIQLNQITLKSDVVELEGAVIRAETSQYRTEIDKRVVDVGKDLVSAGADAAAVLNNIPSVSVDQQTGQLSLRGNENVKVMVDGKPSNIPVDQLLKQLPSNAIAKVEIITNPSSKYEPEGNTGIINIITHKNKRKGYNVALDMGMTQGKYTRHNSGVNANVNTGNFNFFGNYNAYIGKNRFYGDVDNFNSGLKQYFNTVDQSTAQVFKVGVDWFMGEKSALTIYTSQYYQNGSGDADTDLFDNNTQTLFKNYSNDDNTYQNQDYSLNFKQDFGKEDHHIVLDAIYSTSKHHDLRNYFNTFPNDEFSDSRSGKNTSTRINLDYTNKIIDGGKIEAGLQYRNGENINDLTSNQQFMTDNNEVYEPYVNFDFTRSIYSAYLNYGQTFGKLGMQLGLRAEKVEETAKYAIAPTTTGNYKNEYTELYPSAFFTYDLAEKSQFSLSYSRRVDRPHLGQISPVPEWSISTLISEGNPDIKPQFTNSFEFGYLQRFKGGNINAVAFYRGIDDMIFRYITEHPTNENIIVQKYINYDKSESYGLEVSANYRPLKWYSFNASFDIFANKFYLDNVENTSLPWNARINNNFTLNKQLSIQNFFMYRGTYEFIQGKMDPMWRMDLGARYSFMDGKASVSARVSDVFNTFYSKAIIENIVPGTAEFHWESQTLYVGFSYNFGGEVRKRNLEQETEQSASGGGIGF